VRKLGFCYGCRQRTAAKLLPGLRSPGPTVRFADHEVEAGVSGNLCRRQAPAKRVRSTGENGYSKKRLADT
jgi:hypothetical protein